MGLKAQTAQWMEAVGALPGSTDAEAQLPSGGAATQHATMRVCTGNRPQSHNFLPQEQKRGTTESGAWTASEKHLASVKNAGWRHP